MDPLKTTFGIPSILIDRMANTLKPHIQERMFEWNTIGLIQQINILEEKKKNNPLDNTKSSVESIRHTIISSLISLAALAKKYEVTEEDVLESIILQYSNIVEKGN